MKSLQKAKPIRTLAIGALAVSSAIMPMLSICHNTFAKDIKVSDLFEHSGFASEKLFRCALDAYKDANNMVSDNEVVGSSYEEWIENGGQTFDANKLKNVKKIECLTLTPATANDFSTVNYLTGLGQFTNLEALRISAREPLINLQPISTLTHLKYLDLYQDSYNTPINVPSVIGIANLTNLEQLSLTGQVGTNIPDISNLSKLKKLALHYVYDSPDVNHRISDISFLSGLTNLETLDLRGNTIDDEHLSAISSLTNLKYLALDANIGISSNNPVFDNLTNLEYLDIRDEREEDKARTGDPSIHPKFNDGVLYKAVVDSYYREQGDHPFSNDLFFTLEYDAATHRKEILTDEQLASIEHLSNIDGSPSIQATPHLTDSTGLETMPNLKSIDFELMITEDIDITHNPKLEKIYLFCTPLSIKTIDFSKNPELKDVYLWQAAGLETLDFSKNPKLQKLTIWADNNTLTEVNISSNPNLNQVTIAGADNAIIYLTNTDGIESFSITGPAGEANITSATVRIVPPLSTRLVKTPGRGGDNDTNNANPEETFSLNLSNLKFIKNSNTNIEGTIENETFKTKDSNCYTYDAGSNSIIVKASCVAEGLKSATLIHEYTISGTKYTNSFDIDFNPVKVTRKYILDGEEKTFDEPLGKVTLYIGEDFDSSKYEQKFSGYELASVNASILVKGSTTPTKIDTFATSTETKKLGGLSNENITELILTYNYESEDLKVPDTGIFTGDSKNATLLNTLLVLAGLSVAAPIAWFITVRCRKTVNFKR